MNGTNDRSGNPVKGQRPSTLYPQVSGSSGHGKPASFLEQSLVILGPAGLGSLALLSGGRDTQRFTQLCTPALLKPSRPSPDWLLGPETCDSSLSLTPCRQQIIKSCGLSLLMFLIYPLLFISKATGLAEATAS